MVRVSILVVSRTATLLNRLVESLNESYSGDAETAEILISWNGSSEEETRIQPGRLPSQIVQKDPYHFAANMNRLARTATGDVLVFANDDLIADAGAVDAALDRLSLRPEVGLVGARLRTSDGQLAHAGMHFTGDGTPYHQLVNLADANHPTNHQERFVPAVTGAFFAMRRQDFLPLELAESFGVCGEDVLLCLQVRHQLHKQVLYCPAMSGVHDEKSTRGHFQEPQQEHNDLLRLRAGWKEMIQRADKELLAVELQAVQHEAENLRGTCLDLLSHRDAWTELTARHEELSQQLRDQDHTILELKAYATQQTMERSLLEKEINTLRSQVQQLENQMARTAPIKP